MRATVILSLGLVLALLAAPAAAGTLADYKATSGQYKMENGVRIYRVLPVSPQAYQNQSAVGSSEQAFERGYKEGFETALNTRPRNIRPKKSLKRSQTGRSSYNYGRRYSTSGYNPRYNRFRSNISYGRPAYIALTNSN